MVINVEINKTNPRNNFFQNGAELSRSKKKQPCIFFAYWA